MEGQGSKKQHRSEASKAGNSRYKVLTSSRARVTDHPSIRCKIRRMDGPKQTWGVLLSFPSRENITARKSNEGCLECRMLESRIDAAISEIHSVVQSTFPSIGEKLASLFEKQDLRDRAVAAFYAHKRNAHLRKTA
jgi:hypothetical protein